MVNKPSTWISAITALLMIIELSLIGLVFTGNGYPGLRLLEPLTAMALVSLLVRSISLCPGAFRKELVSAVVVSLSLWYSLLVVLGISSGLAVNSYAPNIVTGLLNLVIDTPLMVLAVLGLGEVVCPSISMTRRALSGALAGLLFLGMFTDLGSILSATSGQLLLNTVLEMMALASLLASTLTLLRHGSRWLALGYVLGIRLPAIASPILPFLPLALLSFLVILPSLLVVVYTSSRIATARGHIAEKGPGAGTVIAAALAVLLFLAILWKGYWPMIVLSGSMEPSIKIGDIVVVKRANTLPRVGDIIAYKSSGLVVLHRVINVSNDKIITKGDANNAPDNPITRNQVIGQLYLHIPYIGLPLIITAKLLGGRIFFAQMLLLASIITLIMAPTIIRALRVKERPR